MRLAAILLALAPVSTDECGPCETSPVGQALIQHFEGFSPFVYEDVAGYKTVGFGHLLLPGETIPEPLLPDEATAALQKDLYRTAAGVNDRVEIILQQNQFDAVVSWTFNLGTGALGSSTLLRRVNAGRHSEVPAQFLRWDKAKINGTLQPVRGLTIRRETEAELYGVKP